MIDLNFNESTEIPEFIYRPDDQDRNIFNLYRYKAYKGPRGGYDQIGDYRLVETTENRELTFKKLENICRFLNRKKTMDHFDGLVSKKHLFSVEPRDQQNDPFVVVFRTHDGKSTSEENAILTVEAGVVKDDRH